MKTFYLKSVRIVLLASTLFGLSPPSGAQTPSEASAAMSAGLSHAGASVVAGSASTIAAAASLTMMALEAAGESTVMVLKDMSTGATVSVRASTRAVGAASLATGSIITVAASTAGYSLIVAGQIIAFIPNEIGRSLVHHSRVRGGAAK